MTEAPQREPGFYWIKDNGEWMPGEFITVAGVNAFWLILGSGITWQESDFEAIGPAMSPPVTDC